MRFLLTEDLVLCVYLLQRCFLEYCVASTDISSPTKIVWDFCICEADILLSPAYRTVQGFQWEKGLTEGNGRL